MKMNRKNDLNPEVVGLSANLVPFLSNSSPTRTYMVGGNLAKSVVSEGTSERKIITGMEYQYGKTARRIEAPANMLVEEVFFIKSLADGPDHTDKWNSIWVIFRNDEKNTYDVLELPRYNAQNTYIAFEYVYDKNVMRKLEKGATFSKGTVFAKSPRVSDSGEWMMGIDSKVALGSFHETEEDGIVITRSYAEDKLRCIFKHERKFSWDENEYIPLMLYGTPEDPKPFPESGEVVRSDGIVMGFRRRVGQNALVSLTRKSLRTPDHLSDILFFAPTDTEVMSVEVLSERVKNRSNNRRTEYIPQQHTDLLVKYETKQNDMWNSVVSWYNNKVSLANGGNVPLSDELNNFIRFAMANVTVSNTSGRINNIYRTIKRQRLKDWNVTIKLKERVSGRVKFKMTGMNGDKGVVVKVIEDEDAPSYDDGTTAEIIVNNTPAFRRQIFSQLLEQAVNFVNVNLHKEVKELRKQDKYEEAFDKLFTFYKTGFPEFASIVENVIVTQEDKIEHVDEVCRKQIVVQVRTDAKLTGVNIIRELNKVYGYKPQRINFTNSLGQRVKSSEPVLITNQHFLLLDKFGTDMSAQSLPHSNLFGMPAKLNEVSRHGHYLRNVHNRNSGETESRLRISQSGTKEINKNLAMGYSPYLRKKVTQRIIRADDPFDIDKVVKEDEYKHNKAVSMATNMLSDTGYRLRKEVPSDRTDVAEEE